MNKLHLTIETSINFPIINRAPKISPKQSSLLEQGLVNLTCFQYKQRQKNTQQRGRPEASCSRPCNGGKSPAKTKATAQNSPIGSTDPWTEAQTPSNPASQAHAYDVSASQRPYQLYQAQRITERLTRAWKTDQQFSFSKILAAARVYEGEPRPGEGIRGHG